VFGGRRLGWRAETLSPCCCTGVWALAIQYQFAVSPLNSAALIPRALPGARSQGHGAQSHISGFLEARCARRRWCARCRWTLPLPFSWAPKRQPACSRTARAVRRAAVATAAALCRCTSVLPAAPTALLPGTLASAASPARGMLQPAEPAPAGRARSQAESCGNAGTPGTLCPMPLAMLSSPSAPRSRRAGQHPSCLPRRATPSARAPPAAPWRGQSCTAR